jgi:hypothetical protein
LPNICDRLLEEAYTIAVPRVEHQCEIYSPVMGTMGMHFSQSNPQERLVFEPIPKLKNGASKSAREDSSDSKSWRSVIGAPVPKSETATTQSPQEVSSDRSWRSVIGLL